MQTIALCDPIAINAAPRKFKDVRSIPGSAHAPSLHRWHATHYVVVAAQVDNIDGLQHERAVDAAASGEKQAFVDSQWRRQHEAAQAGGEAVSDVQGKRVCALAEFLLSFSGKAKIALRKQEW
jgi:hypothetical protein